MSLLSVKITFAPNVNLSNFSEPPALVLFYPEQLESMSMDIYNYLEFCH